MDTSIVTILCLHHSIAVKLAGQRAADWLSTATSEILYNQNVAAGSGYETLHFFLQHTSCVSFYLSIPPKEGMYEMTSQIFFKCLIQLETHDIQLILMLPLLSPNVNGRLEESSITETD